MDIEGEKKKIKMMVGVGTVLWVIGFLLVLSVFYLEFLGPYSAIPDSTGSKTLMTLKLGGIGFILSGVFIALLAIVKALGLMPDKLGMLLAKQ